MINAIWLLLIIPVSFCLGFFLYMVIDLWEKRHEEIKEIIDKEERLEIIEEVFNEHGDCDHDVIQPTSDVPGEHFVSYYVDKRGKEKILEAL